MRWPGGPTVPTVAQSTSGSSNDGSRGLAHEGTSSDSDPVELTASTIGPPGP